MFHIKNVQIGDSKIYFAHYNDFLIEDYLPFLYPEEHKKLATFLSPKRRSEYVATRVLKETIFPKKLIQHSSNGAPFIEETPYHISISHCKGLVAIAVCKRYAIGLDVEPISDKAQRLHKKFINSDEAALLNTNDSLLMTRTWSCKEALFKLANRKGVIFKTDLFIHSFDENELFKCIIINGERKIFVDLTSKIIGHFILTINNTALIEE